MEDYQSAAIKISYGDLTTPLVNEIERMDQKRLIYETLDSGKPVLIRGLRRVGKTSLAEYGNLSLNLSYLEINAIEFRSFSGFQDALAGRVAQFIQDKYSESVEIDDDPLRFLNQYLGGKEKKVTLFIDELECFEDLPIDELFRDFIEPIKSLNNIHFLGSLLYQREDEEKIREFYNHCQIVFVRPLEYKEVEEVVREPLKNSGISFSDESIERIYQISGGASRLVRIICTDIMQGIHQGTYEIDSTHGVIGQDMIDTYVQDVYKDLDYHYRPQQHGTKRKTLLNTFMNWEEQVSSEQKKTLLGILDGVETDENVTDLIKVGLVRKEEDDYIISSSLFARYLDEIIRVSMTRPDR